jgi:hypothetical protein
MNAEQRLPSHLLAKLVYQAQKLTGRKDIGLLYGLTIKPTSHELLGYALMSCATLGEAMQVLGRYQSMYIRDVYQQVLAEPSTLTITFRESRPLGASHKLYLEVFLAAVCGQHHATNG